MLQVLNSEENSNAKKLLSLQMKESHKGAQSANEDTNKLANKNINNSFKRSKQPRLEVDKMEQSGNHPNQHKIKKQKINNFVGGNKKHTSKRKKVEEAKEKPTQYVYLL